MNYEYKTANSNSQTSELFTKTSDKQKGPWKTEKEKEMEET